jgi:molybdenum cofactor cytidylyltransferase
VIAGILLAAGQASRYGGAKLLERFQGETLLRRAATAFVEGGCDPLIIVVPVHPPTYAALDGFDATLVANPEPELGIGHSIALGVAAVPEQAEAAVIGVADQPLLTSEMVKGLMGAFSTGHIVIPRYGEQAGNPRVYDRLFFDELRALTGDRGGQLLAERHPDAVIEISLPARLGIDIDTPDDWKRLR